MFEDNEKVEDEVKTKFSANLNENDAVDDLEEVSYYRPTPCPLENGQLLQGLFSGKLTPNLRGGLVCVYTGQGYFTC